jgi:Na+-transporting methylmalonyl-CoA/oxaloacetate decarboxylase gamma subunit
MDANLLSSLWITLLGMGLVFGAIVLLWGMMAALGGLSARRRRRQAAAESDPQGARRAAAAAAVAFALARESAPGERPNLALPPTVVVSAWQLARRTENLKKQGNRR